MCNHGSSLKDGKAHDAAHATWTRRQFMRGLAVAGAGVSMGLGGVPVRASSDAALARALAASDPNRVLVLIQLAGGNDGLNTVVPIGNDLYHQARSRLGLTSSQVIPLSLDTGLHSSLAPWESRFKDGQLAIVQNVGYPDPALSHFVSTDVWMGAEDADDLSGTGWLGRYLEQAQGVSANSDRPVAMQIGASSPLIFQGPSRSMGVSFPSPSLLNRLAQNGTLFDEDNVPDSLVGAELSWVRGVANDSFVYARGIQDAYTAGQNAVSYPGTSLARNLAIVARLIRGGLGSRVYHVSLGSFDTHANQLGVHATLLRYLADATAAFMADLESDGWSENVVAMTFSEFGRRIAENASSGTDHGTAAPLFLLGGGVQGGLFGSPPDLANLDGSGNLVAQLDFRSVYASLLSGWFEVPVPLASELVGGAIPSPSLFGASTGTAAWDAELPGSLRIEALFPNPTTGDMSLRLSLDRGQQVRIMLVDMLGRMSIGVLDGEYLAAGAHSIQISVPGHVAAGPYLMRIQAGVEEVTRPFTVVR